MSMQSGNGRRNAAMKQRVSLASAAETFWPVLFPDDSTRSKCIEEWVIENIVDAGKHTDPRHSSQASAAEIRKFVSVEVVSDTVNLQILVQDGAQLRFAERLGNWLAMPMSDPAWREKHPVIALRARPSDDRCLKQVKTLLRSAVDSVQNKVVRQLVQALSAGQLTAWAVEAVRPLDDPRRVPAKLFTGNARLTPSNDQILPEFGGPLISVTIEGPPAARDLKLTTTSFKDADHASFTRMRDLISEGVSVSKAAERVEPEAARRTKSSAESVIERLRRGYPRWEKEQEALAKMRI